MAYSASGLKLLQPGVGGGPQLWSYSSADAHGTVDGTDYFADAGSDYGMREGDYVLVYDTATPTVTLHVVSDVDTDGNATITAATLA